MTSARQRRRSKKTGTRGGRRRRDPELVELGDRLRALRDAAGLTQEEVAAGGNQHSTYVGQIERGERNPTYKSLRRLEQGLGVEPGRLMSDRG